MKSPSMTNEQVFALTCAQPQKETYEDFGLPTEIRRLLTKLTCREEKVIRMYFGIGEDYYPTFTSIAKDFGVSRERVRQIYYKAIRKLRHPKNSIYLRQYILS